MDARDQALAHVANGCVISIVLLANCLKKNGAILPDQLEAALQGTIDAPGAAKDRLDYKLLAQTLKLLRGPVPPSLTVIEGGKRDDE